MASASAGAFLFFTGFKMFGVMKFVRTLFLAYRDLLHIDRNALKAIPDQSKYLAMILLSCFWCLAFGIYFGELLVIGYNMLGHVALITMVFVTWLTFRHYQMINPLRSGVDYLRAPDRSSRCDEYTDEERERLTTRR
jgi:fatty acid desaturase